MDSLSDAKIIELSASNIAQLILEKKLTSERTVRAFLSRISEINPTINAVVERNPNVIEEAKELDRELSEGKIRGPLHGVPFTFKEQFPVRGFKQTQGLLALKDHVAQEDSIIYKRLRDAGAVLLGTTNQPEFALSYESNNLVYGRTSNPHDPSRTAGGSSGGEAAIVAAKGTPFGIGSDIGGSIRLPAHYNGICGIKATKGAVPLSKCYYLGEGINTEDVLTLSGEMASIGPLSRFAEDLELVYSVISGTDFNDSFCLVKPYKFGASKEIDVKKLRVGYFTEVPDAPVTECTKEAVLKVVEMLKKNGNVVTEAVPPGIVQSAALFFRVFNRRGTDMMKQIAFANGNDVSQGLKAMFQVMDEGNLKIEQVGQFEGLLVEWKMHCNSVMRFMKDFDVVISPVAAFPAPPHDSPLSLNMFKTPYAVAWNVAGLPAIVVGDVTRGKGDFAGLPVGVQIIGTPYSEDALFAISKFVQGSL
eukprot:TRINITY_DN1665_c0_g1_i3.p1 TRINITY_DN1665_c0_g1~~TRINITY_DN1665_c0_g1_i3.p1  ORF type:complete len:476 (-),score=114.82 TRINITY_DN1665_c0_g1_i3:49-1476(-)